MSKRRDARERVMQALYACEVGGHAADDVVTTVLEPALKEDRETMKFATSLLLRSLDHAGEIDEIIKRHTRNWDFERIAVIDRLLLRLSITEFLYFEDIPPKVSMNESIEVAKKYSTAKSGQFINGILDAVLAEFDTAGKLHKTGRGLVGSRPGGKASPPRPESDHD